MWVTQLKRTRNHLPCTGPKVRVGHRDTATDASLGYTVTDKVLKTETIIDTQCRKHHSSRSPKRSCSLSRTCTSSMRGAITASTKKWERIWSLAMARRARFSACGRRMRGNSLSLAVSTNGIHTRTALNHAAHRES